jgi:adenine-specific DNA-methyltransferase
VLIDDLLRATKESEHDIGQLTPDLFADFNGMPKSVPGMSFHKLDKAKNKNFGRCG